MTTEEGYVIIQTTRTDSYEPKPDIVATKSGKQKIVEVKRYSSKYYPSRDKKGQLKKAKPEVEARHNVAGALHQLIRDKCYNPDADIALGFPDCEIYRRLLGEIQWFLDKFAKDCYLVRENGTVHRGLGK